MSVPDATPVPPHLPADLPPANVDAPLPRRTQVAALALLGLIATLSIWRWHSDFRDLRPTDVQPDPGYRVDLNRASRSELMRIPGVGPQLAERIVAHRDGHGRYARVEDLTSVHGVGDATLNRLRPWLTIDVADATPTEPDVLTRKPTGTRHVVLRPSGPAELIDLNTATPEQLNTLPNIGPVLAQRIIDERTRKPFAKVDDLRRVSGIGPKRMEAIRPLVTVRE